MNSINNNEINEMNVINTSEINIINSDETNIIEKNIKILCEIKKLIDTNYPINDLINLIKNDYLNENYMHKLIVLMHELSLNYFFYKKIFYFYRNGIWYKYLTENLTNHKKDGKCDKALININLAIIVDKGKMCNILKKTLKKNIKKNIFESIIRADLQKKDEIIDNVCNFQEDYKKILKNNEKSDFYKKLLILCEYLFTHNDDQILFTSIDFNYS